MGYCNHCDRPMSLCVCPVKPVMKPVTINHQAKMADRCEGAMVNDPCRSDVRRSASGEAHDAIEKMRAENESLRHELVATRKDLHGTHEALCKALNDVRVAQDFAIQLTQRIERTGR